MSDTNVSHYEILRNDKYGRYLVASKDLESGELIFVETPFAVGPKPDTPPLCLGCYCPVSEGGRLCSRCSWPCCGPECEASPQHAPECAVFSQARVRFQPVRDWTAGTPQLDCITPLRLLIAKEQDPDRWTRELEEMETHTEERRRRPTWDADQTNVAGFLVDHCKLAGRFDKELVQKVCGILE
ncbi:SET domain-containing protein SmydA-8, isoform A, partial [Eumeta japonica]